MEKLLQQLAEQLNTTVPYLWEVLVNQAFYGGLINLTFLGVWMFLSGVLFYVSYKLYNKIEDETDRIFTTFALILIASAISIISLLCLPDQVNRVLNPEYWALNEIMEVVEGD